jgi:hypothetical protein
VQVIGPRYREDLCLDAAAAIEDRLGIHHADRSEVRTDERVGRQAHLTRPADVGGEQALAAGHRRPGDPRGTSLLDPTGELRIDPVLEAIASRLHLVPRFRQVIHVPRRGRGGPLWMDAPDSMSATTS